MLIFSRDKSPPYFALKASGSATSLHSFLKSSNTGLLNTYFWVFLRPKSIETLWYLQITVFSKKNLLKLMNDRMNAWMQHTKTFENMWSKGFLRHEHEVIALPIPGLCTRINERDSTEKSSSCWNLLEHVFLILSNNRRIVENSAFAEDPRNTNSSKGVLYWFGGLPS